MWGNVSVHQSKLPCFFDDGPRVLSGLVILSCDWNDLISGEFASEILQRFLLLG